MKIPKRLSLFGEGEITKIDATGDENTESVVIMFDGASGGIGIRTARRFGAPGELKIGDRARVMAGGPSQLFFELIQ